MTAFAIVPIGLGPRCRPRDLHCVALSDGARNGDTSEPLPRVGGFALKRSILLLTRKVPPWLVNEWEKSGLSSESVNGDERDNLEEDGDGERGDSNGEVADGVEVGAGKVGLPDASNSFTASLQMDPPTRTFYVRPRKITRGANTAKRRRTDPPYVYFDLHFGVVEKGSVDARNSASPRVSGSGLKQWYKTAAKWNVLREVSFVKDPLLVLDQTRHVVFGANSDGNVVSAKRPPSRRPQASDLDGENDSSQMLSPILWNEVWSRALGKHPRLIVVGDVHGCLTELQELLRLADFQPGDQVIFLGDLVAKGPDSAGVVHLAREIDAKAVRGNHDHEVVRWRETIIRGEDPITVSAEHSRVGQQLSPLDHEFLRRSPWFINSPDLGFLFVHAGFMPGLRLSQQNPRLMMNMRSVLTDGTVTAKNVKDRTWANLWTGPETVVFGHDALRGLQVHDHAIGIDTGCVYGGRLTALILPENRFISVAAKKAYRSQRRRVINNWPSD